MTLNRRTDHLVASLGLYADAMAAPPARLTYDQKIALAQLHATLAGVGADMMGQKDARNVLSTPEEQEKIAQREATKARKRRGW